MERLSALCDRCFIEHFQPAVLLEVMDHYLDRLRLGGHLIILTPLMSSRFYDDFDHVKTYHPQAILTVFGWKGWQVQYYARNRLRLVDVRFRRRPFCPVFRRWAYLESHAGFFDTTLSLSRFVFNVSGGLIGRTDGWGGLFEKVSADSAEFQAEPPAKSRSGQGPFATHSRNLQGRSLDQM